MKKYENYNSRSIENIKTGDKVVSTNAETFEIAEKNVIETYIHTSIKETLNESYYANARSLG